MPLTYALAETCERMKIWNIEMMAIVVGTYLNEHLWH
jgi:hypothetical protein